jgi:hypothetical protein
VAVRAGLRRVDLDGWAGVVRVSSAVRAPPGQGGWGRPPVVQSVYAAAYRRFGVMACVRDRGAGQGRRQGVDGRGLGAERTGAGVVELICPELSGQRICG